MRHVFSVKRNNRGWMSAAILTGVHNTTNISIVATEQMKYDDVGVFDNFFLV